MDLKQRAEKIINILKTLPSVKNCDIYGSIVNGTYDELSDIDIEIDVSGIDNGQFMLKLINLLKDKINIVYSDYAPSLIPNSYIVSIAIDKTNPFLIVDLKCVATPNCTTVTKELVRNLNNKYTHILKLWTANLKHYARKKDCFKDILNMAKKINLDVNNKNEKEILYQTLIWLKVNASEQFKDFINNCSVCFNNLVKI